MNERINILKAKSSDEIKLRVSYATLFIILTVYLHCTHKWVSLVPFHSPSPEALKKCA
jgi:hypothetical protein